MSKNFCHSTYITFYSKNIFMKNHSSITTRTGDEGKTCTLGGDRVFKNDLRVVIPGSIDELISQISLVKLLFPKDSHYKRLLEWIQACLFVIASRFSDPYSKSIAKKQMTEDELHFLDSISSSIEANTEMPRSFVIPGTTEISCQMDIARCICRRIERTIVEFSQEFQNHAISKETFAFINRLSDFFYILARKEENGNFLALDYSIIENFPKK